MTHPFNLAGLNCAILITAFVFVVGIGWMLKRHMKGSPDFFLSRSIPAWVTGLAFLSANRGAQGVIGMAASGAKYGIMIAVRAHRPDHPIEWLPE